MKMMKIALCLLALTFAFAHTAQANEQGFGVPRVTAYPAAIPVSKFGKVTGLGCGADKDCTLGCMAGSNDDILCLTQEESSNACVDPDAPAKADYACACLPDVSRCGFVFQSITEANEEKAKAEREAAEKRAENPAPVTKPVAKKAPKKKTATKKPRRKKTSK